MAITHIGQDSEQNASGNTADMTFTLPSHATDDFGIISATVRNTGAAVAIGAASGWTELRSDTNTTGDTTVTYIWYKKFTSASETNPTITIDLGRNRAFIGHVFRGVDTTTPFDVTEVFTKISNASNPTNAAITTANANGCLLLTMGNTNGELTALGVPATPASLTAGAEAFAGGSSVDMASCYLLDYGAAGTITPTAWTNTVTSSTGEAPCYTVALRAQAAAAASAPSYGRLLVNVG